MVTRVLALNADGDITFCSAPPEKRGQGRCNHTLHQEPGETGLIFQQRAEDETEAEVSLKRPKEFLDEALKSLDDRLTDLKLEEPMELRVIGGYALMHHGLRKGGMTMDLDTVTKSYEHRIRAQINEVGRDYALEKDWINNENIEYNDVAHVERLIKYDWIETDAGYKNIKLSVADLETLTRTKIAAVDVWDRDSHRKQDPDDLFDLLDAQGISNYSEFKKKFGRFTDDGYLNAGNFVKNYYEGGREAALNNMATVEEEWDKMMDDLDSGDSWWED